MSLSRPIRKYPRTPHLTGSHLQAGDHDLKQIPLEDLKGLLCLVALFESADESAERDHVPRGPLALQGPECF